MNHIHSPPTSIHQNHHHNNKINHRSNSRNKQQDQFDRRKNTQRQQFQDNFNIDKITLNILDDQTERNFKKEYSIFQEKLFYVLLVLITVLLIEKSVKYSSNYYTYIISISVFVSIIITLAAKKYMIITFFKFLYFIILLIYIFKEFDSMKSNHDDEIYHHNNKDRIQLIWNHSILILLSAFTLSNWILSVLLLYIFNAIFYWYLTPTSFSIIQILSFIYPIFFYFNLKREKILFASQALQLIHFIETVLPFGLIILDSNQNSQSPEELQQQQQQQSSLISQFIHYCKSKNNNKSITSTQVEQSNLFKRCCSSALSIVCFPCYIFKIIKRKCTSKKQQKQQNINSSPQISKQQEFQNVTSLNQLHTARQTGNLIEEDLPQINSNNQNNNNNINVNKNKNNNQNSNKNNTITNNNIQNNNNNNNNNNYIINKNNNKTKITKKDIDKSKQNKIIENNNLNNLRKQPFSASGSTYSSSAQNLSGENDFCIRYINQQFIKNFVEKNTNTSNNHSPNQLPSISPTLSFQPTQGLSNSHHQNLNQQQQNKNNQEQIYPFNPSLPQIIKTLKKMNIEQQNKDQMNNNNKLENTPPYPPPLYQNNSQIKTILSQLNIPLPKEEKISSTQKIFPTLQQDTPNHAKSNHSHTLNPHPLSYQFFPNSPVSDEQVLFSNVNLQKNQEIKPIISNTHNFNSLTNSNHTVIFSSKNILSHEDSDPTKLIPPFKNSLLNQSAANKQNNNNNNNNLNLNHNKSKFLSINPCLAQQTEGESEEYSNGLPTTHRQLQQDQYDEQQQTHQQKDQIQSLGVVMPDKKLKRPSIAVIEGDNEDEEYGDKDKSHKLINANSINNKQNIHTLPNNSNFTTNNKSILTVYEYIKHRLTSNPFQFHKPKRNSDEINLMKNNVQLNQKNATKQQEKEQQQQQLEDEQEQGQDDSEDEEEEDFDENLYNQNEEQQQDFEEINCFQIDERSDMKKSITVSFINGQWQGDNALFLIVRKTQGSADKILVDKLNEVETFKSSLLKTVSHDLKTPLNGMTIFLEDIILYFRNKLKKVHQQIQKNNNNMNNNQTLAHIQLSQIKEGHSGQSLGNSSTLIGIGGNGGTITMTALNGTNNINGLSNTITNGLTTTITNGLATTATTTNGLATTTTTTNGLAMTATTMNGLNTNQNIMKTTIIDYKSIDQAKSIKLPSIVSATHFKEKKSLIQNHIENLNQVLYSTKILTSVIDDILDYSAIKINLFRVNSDAFDIRLFLNELKEFFSKTFEQKKLQLLLELPNQTENNPLIIYNDQKRIKQVLINMVSNSIKYTSKGYCKIIVKKSEHQPDIIYISVKDTGSGMDSATIDKLFQLYQNTDSDIHGVGLGLVICRNLVGYLGPSQEIDVESELGKGSTFRFALYTNNISNRSNINNPHLKSTIKNDLAQSEINSQRDIIQDQKNLMSIVNVGGINNQKQNFQSNHSLRVGGGGSGGGGGGGGGTNSNNQMFSNINKSLFLQSPTIKNKNKSNNLHHSVQSFDQLPKNNLKSYNLQVQQQSLYKYDNSDRELCSTRNNNNNNNANNIFNQSNNKIIKNQQEIIGLEKIEDNSNKTAISIVLNEKIQFNKHQFQNAYQSERLIQLKNDNSSQNHNQYNYHNNIKHLLSQNKSEGSSQKQPQQEYSFHTNIALQRSQILSREDNKQQFTQIQKIQLQGNDTSSQLSSSFLESIDYDDNKNNDNNNNIDNNNNSQKNIPEIIEQDQIDKNNQDILNEIKSQQYSQSYDCHSGNNNNNLHQSMNNTSDNREEESHAEYISIEQEQYGIPEFGHHQNNLQSHYIQLPNKRILIVDDSFFNQIILEKLLQNIHGIELIDKAENGEIALIKIQELYETRRISYDLILMDWNMPIIDGLQATQLIRQIPFLSNHPPYILFVTASSAQEKDTFLSAGANAYLEKPVNTQAFYEEYNKFLEYEYHLFYLQQLKHFQNSEVLDEEQYSNS